MTRVEGKCIGDCSKCKLLENEEVDMIPCVLDQIFQKVIENERELLKMRELLSSQPKEGMKLAGLDEAIVED